MGFEADLVTINSHFNTQWADATPVAWPNTQFDPTDETEWVRLTVLQGDTEQITLGGDTNTYRIFGTVIIQVFVESNSGAKRALELVDLVNNIWRSLQTNGLVFRAPDIHHVGNADGYYQINVSCPYYRNEIA